MFMTSYTRAKIGKDKLGGIVGEYLSEKCKLTCARRGAQ